MSVMVRGHPQTFTLDPAGGCCIWTGLFHKKSGRPVTYSLGQQAPASRVMWELVHGPLLQGTQLVRLCLDIRCVSPYHHVIRSPHTAIRRAGLRPSSLTMVKRLIRSATKADPTLRMVFTGPLASLECDPASVVRLAAQVPGMPTYAVWCGYAALALEAKPALDSTQPDVADVVESRLLLRLAELGEFGDTHE